MWSLPSCLIPSRENGRLQYTFDRPQPGSSKSQSLFAAAGTYPYLRVRFLNHSLFCRAEFRELGSSSPGLGRAATPCKPRLNWREPLALRRSFTGDAYKSRGFDCLKLEGQPGDCKYSPAMEKPAQPCQAGIGMFMLSNDIHHRGRFASLFVCTVTRCYDSHRVWQFRKWRRQEIFISP